MPGSDLDPKYQRFFTPSGNGPSDDAVGRASSLLGMHERRNTAMLKDYLHNGGQNLNPAQLAWCAAFVNSTLAQSGMKGTGSAVATSFMNWGQPVQGGGVHRNDVLVFPRGRAAGQTGGHVGIATGNIRNGMVEMISGNHGDSVARTWEPLRDAMVRRWGDGVPQPTMMASAAPSMATPSEAPQIEIAPPPAPEAEPDAPEMQSYAMMAGDEGSPGGDAADLSALQQPMMGGEEPAIDATVGMSDVVNQKAAMRKQKMAELTTPLGQLFNEQVVGMAGKGRA
jgi:uncharacterized protein (TIGR02594 family)